jgi:hypothetical protein
VRTVSGAPGNVHLEHLQEAGRQDLKDFFAFRIGDAMTDLDGAPYGGSRYPVDAMMAQRTFAKFHMDVGIGDVVLDPLERIKTHDWLGFAEIAPACVPMIQREQQFAEKLHAYTLPRSGANSRVRDLVDMVLLIQSETLNASVCLEALRRTFERRGTHDLHALLEPPPATWEKPFQRLAEECQLDPSVSKAFAELSGFYAKLC